jgi:excisionase family DNA binding protein
MATMAREIMTVGELVQWLRVDRTTIYRLLKRGDIPAFRVGSDWRFQREAVERWIAAGGDVLDPTEQPHERSKVLAERGTDPPQPDGRHRGILRGPSGRRRS